MAQLPDGIPGIPSKVERLSCYSDFREPCRARVFYPEHPEQVRRIFEQARARGCKVTMRGGAHSFDDQSLGESMVISLSAMNEIEVLPERRMRVGPGATWGKIFSTLEPMGLLPAVTVTTAHATAGGTLSGDCLSRFSPAYGKEGEWIESFDLITPMGEMLHCQPPAPGVMASSPGQKAFYGVIGGLGYLGAVVSITYRLLSVPDRRGTLGVATTVAKHDSFEGVASELMDVVNRAQVARGQCADANEYLNDPTKTDAVYSCWHVDPEGTTGMVMRSHVTTSSERRPFKTNQPNWFFRIPIEWMMRSTRLNRFCWQTFYKRVKTTEDAYIDDLDGYTFFMDGNVRAKHLGQLLGRKMKACQQTFVVPNLTEGETEWTETHGKLIDWLQRADKLFKERGLTPTFTDVLHLPADDRFLLSATAGMAGYAVSYAFETSKTQTLGQVEQAFTDLSNMLRDRFRGRVYLVKNVNVERETVWKMYGQNALDFFELKDQLDPENTLTNRFLERTFGERPERQRNSARFKPGVSAPVTP